MTDQEQFDVWFERVVECYRYARQSRLQILNGKRTRDWRDDGLHGYSYLWGIADASCPAWFGAAVVEAPDLLGIGPTQLRSAAEADALDEFVARLVAA